MFAHKLATCSQRTSWSKWNWFDWIVPVIFIPQRDKIFFLNHPFSIKFISSSLRNAIIVMVFFKLTQPYERNLFNRCDNKTTRDETQMRCTVSPQNGIQKYDSWEIWTLISPRPAALVDLVMWHMSQFRMNNHGARNRTLHHHELIQLYVLSEDKGFVVQWVGRIWHRSTGRAPKDKRY